MSRRRKYKTRAVGFNGLGQRHFWSAITSGIGVKRREQRRYFNRVAGIMVLGGGVAGALFGYSLLGWIGALIGIGAGAHVMGKYVTNNRYYR